MCNSIMTTTNFFLLVCFPLQVIIIPGIIMSVVSERKKREIEREKNRERKRVLGIESVIRFIIIKCMNMFPCWSQRDGEKKGEREIDGEKKGERDWGGILHNILLKKFLAPEENNCWWESSTLFLFSSLSVLSLSILICSFSFIPCLLFLHSPFLMMMMILMKMIHLVAFFKMINSWWWWILFLDPIHSNPTLLHPLQWQSFFPDTQVVGHTIRFHSASLFISHPSHHHSFQFFALVVFLKWNRTRERERGRERGMRE